MTDQHLTPPNKRAYHRVTSEPQTPPAVDLIDRNEVCEILRKSRSSSYDDPEVAALAIEMTDGERKRKLWQRHEVIALVQARMARRNAQAAAIRAEVLARRERELARKRLTPKQRAKRGKATTK